MVLVRSVKIVFQDFTAVANDIFRDKAELS